MSEDTATFYGSLNYQGVAFAYTLGDLEEVTGFLNDRFKSVRVGLNVKVLAWENYGCTGRYREWEVDTPDISDIGGLSVFKVNASTTLSIAVHLQDDTGAEAGRYSLTVESNEVGKLVTHSGDPEFALVGTMPEAGPPVTTAIYVRDEQSGQYVATGAVYVAWNHETRAVDIADSTNFPTNMTNERTGLNQFTFHLTAAP